MVDEAAPKPVVDRDFPCSLLISTPFPTHRLASFALQALRVDAELSPLVRRSFSLARPEEASSNANPVDGPVPDEDVVRAGADDDEANGPAGATKDKVVLRTLYEATTNRMLRVAVNGFMESLALVTDVMETLDVDVLPTFNDLV